MTKCRLSRDGMIQCLASAKSIRGQSFWEPNFQWKRRLSSVNARELRFGQPLHETHPHILKSGELTPGITALEYAERRARLASRLPTKSIAILAATDVIYRTGHVFYDFHQDPDFYYLTGFNEPQALAVIAKSGSANDHSFHLFSRESDPSAETWEGGRSGTQAAQDVFNADESGDIALIDQFLNPLLKDASQIYTDIISTQPKKSSLFSRLFRKDIDPPGVTDAFPKDKIRPLRPFMNDLRIVKSAAEIQNMRTAGRASGRAFTEAAKQRFEREKLLEASLIHQFIRQGCDRKAFEPVVAGGTNALGIHYVRNDDILVGGQLVLVDAGGEYGGYLADITRTWPISGSFTPAQRDLYEAVLAVQRSCIAACTQSANKSMEDLHEKAERGLKEELKQIGFDISRNAMSVLFPHHLSHHVGLDLHDCISYSKRLPVQTGQCITIEPGIYVPEDDDRFPKHFRGMGIRIEDSVCVGDASPLVLSAEAVKEVEDIEALRS